MPKIINPILKGFNPDPSICRVGDNFYIANSTFEWYPGVTIHHSLDLVNWTLVARPLNRSIQLNMAGNPSSGGVWAPCLSYSEGLFYLIYTDVKSWAGAAPDYENGFKDTHNYLVTSKKIDGEWSDPIYMNSSGFDPSLFHDDDGRKWFVNMIWDYRPGRNSFAGVALQEYSPQENRLTGPVRNIFKGSDIGLTEAPHLYKRNGYYYLLTAEGGTVWEHASTLARSRNIEGPYELHPRNPLLTSVKNRTLVKEGLKGNTNTLREGLFPGPQKAGHASMVEWKENEWILAHLSGRPLKGTLFSPLGRETSLQKIIWKNDGWPYLEKDFPQSEVFFSDKEGSSTPRTYKKNKIEWREDFDKRNWDMELQTLRVFTEDDYDLTIKKSWLRLYGAESPSSLFRQTLLARRVTSFEWRAETCIEFSPDDFQAMAGLIIRYDESTQAYLRIAGEENGRTLGIISFDHNEIDLPLGEQEIRIPDGPIFLAVEMKEGKILFSWSTEGDQWNKIGPSYEAYKFSDEYARPLGFTGMFVGIGCHDVSGRRAPADFDYLTYKEV